MATSLTEAFTATRDLSFGTSLTTAKMSSSPSECPTDGMSRNHVARLPSHNTTSCLSSPRLFPTGAMRSTAATANEPVRVRHDSAYGLRRLRWIDEREESLLFEVNSGTAIRVSSPAPMENRQESFHHPGRNHQSQYANRSTHFKAETIVPPNACNARGK